MVTCYENKISYWNSAANASYVFDGNTYPGLTNWCLTMMMRWSALDPVDDIEIARNNVIAAKQNRNPFIDYPGLEDYIWGDKKNVAFSYDHYDGSSSGKQYVTMSFSPTSVTATLGESFTAPTLSMSPSGLTVTYSSSNTNVATVNASTGAVTLKALETTTLTAFAIRTATMQYLPIRPPTRSPETRVAKSPHQVVKPCFGRASVDIKEHLMVRQRSYPSRWNFGFDGMDLVYKSILGEWYLWQTGLKFSKWFYGSKNYCINGLWIIDI